jgi:D-alanine-D-alanine ligase-like ATP-grasp enzyme
MPATDGSRLALTALETAVRGGSVPREVALRLDLLRGLGAKAAWQRRKAQRELAMLGDEPWNAVYLRIWSDAADALGASVENLGYGFLELRRGSSSTRVWRQYTELDGPVALRLALDRRIGAKLLRQAGIPVPESMELDPLSPDDGVAFLAGGPCVVKPASGTGVGSGVTSGVTNHTQLRRALLRVAQYGRAVLERQLDGTVYRFLYLDGELLDVVRKLPPTVVGDGRSTIASLVEAENRHRIDSRGSAGLALLKLDHDALFTLQAAGLGPASIPASGTRVTVKSVTNQNRNEDSETVPRSAIDDRLVAEGAAAVEAIGLRLSGVDVVTTDLGAPLRGSGGGVIDVNGMPGLNHHYHVAEPAHAVPVAVTILAALLDG